MKNTIPKKIPLLFSRPKKIRASFIDPKKILFGQNVRPKKILRTPPSLKYVIGAPGIYLLLVVVIDVVIRLCVIVYILFKI